MVDGLEEVKISLETIFTQLWEDETPIAYMNVSFTPPSTGTRDWVRLNVLIGSITLVGIPGLYRGIGLMDVQIFSVEGKGSGRALALANKVNDEFSGLTYEGVLFRSADIAIQGIRDGWFQVNAGIPFQFEILKS